jgi:CheY-like chemotaxis protein
MIAIANSIQFWRGIPPKITPCLTNQSTGAPPQEKNIEKLFHPPLAGYYEKSGNFSRTCRISMTEGHFRSWIGTKSLNSLLNISTGTNPQPPRDVWGGCYVERGKFVSMAELPVILVIEDDEAIQGIVEDALSEGGFETAIAASGEEAVTLLIGKKTDYRALVTDINLLGRLDGWEVARRAREIDPAFPVVYMSGQHAEEWASKGVPNSIMLAKPFAPAQLVTAVSQLLNTGTPTT